MNNEGHSLAVHRVKYASIIHTTLLTANTNTPTHIVHLVMVDMHATSHLYKYTTHNNTFNFDRTHTAIRGETLPFCTEHSNKCITIYAYSGPGCDYFSSSVYSCFPIYFCCSQVRMYFFPSLFWDVCQSVVTNLISHFSLLISRRDN